MDVCVWVSVCTILPVWHFRPAAARYRVWLLSGAELAVVGVVLKGLDYGSLPAVLFHCFTFLMQNFSGVFSCFAFCLLLCGEVSVCACVILNVKIDMRGTALHKNKPSFFSFDTCRGP